MTPDTLAELANYRAHRFGITRLESGEFALFDPHGELLAIGSIPDLASLIPTGPDHYETCVDTWLARPRFRDITGGARLLEQLGLGRAAPAPTPFPRRI